MDFCIYHTVSKVRSDYSDKFNKIKKSKLKMQYY